MSRMVRLVRDGISSEMRDRTPNGDCIGLFTPEDLRAAGELVRKQGCVVIQGKFMTRREADSSLIGVVIFEVPLEETRFTSATPRQVLRGLCHAIEARACMLAWAKDNKKRRRPVKPWMLKPRTWFGRGIMAAHWY